MRLNSDLNVHSGNPEKSDQRADVRERDWSHMFQLPLNRASDSYVYRVETDTFKRLSFMLTRGGDGDGADSIACAASRFCLLLALGDFL